MSYQWQEDVGGVWTNLSDAGRVSGSQTDTLTITGIVPADEGSYRCWMNNGYEMDTYTDGATLTVDIPPVIDTQPSSSEIVQGSNASFITAAHGTPTPTYQWQYYNGGIWNNLTDTGRISGSTEATLNITGALAVDAGSYQCVITNGIAPDATTDAVTLTVDYGPIIDAQPSSSEIVQGSNTSFVTAAHGVPTVVYKWQILVGAVWTDLSDVGRISGSSTAVLSITGALVADVGSYRCHISNGISPDAYTNTVVLTVDLAPVIDTQPVDAEKNQGQTATFLVTAHGIPSLTYHWQILSGITWNNIVDGGRVSGSLTSTLTIASVQPSDVGSYRCWIANSISPDAYTNTVTLSVDVVPYIITQPVAQTISLVANATFSVVVSGTPPFTYQWQKSRVNIPGATSSSFTLGPAIYSDQGEYRVIVTDVAGSTTSNEVYLTVIDTKKPGASNNPDDVANMPGFNSTAPGAQTTGATQGTSDSEDVLKGVNIQATDVVLLDQQSGNANGDAPNNSQGANLGRVVLTS